MEKPLQPPTSSLGDKVEDASSETNTKTTTAAEILSSLSHGEYRHLVHRIDRRLIPVMGLIHCISLMDRSNVGAAAIAGMTTELELGVGARYVGASLEPIAHGKEKPHLADEKAVV